MGRFKEIEIGLIDIFFSYRVENGRTKYETYETYINTFFNKYNLSPISPSPMWQTNPAYDIFI